jgi:crotonobetainyl-CoA:carnitine CoA-transferase CaiB-like acyl-CoA transferase
LRERERSGRGCKLDIAMADNLFTFMYWAMGDGLAANRWPQPGRALVTGGSPRYRIYRTRDDRFLAAAPLEERFWQNFCDAIGLAPGARDDRRDPQAVIQAVAARIRDQTAEEWRAVFAGKDVCCNVVGSIEQALADPHFRARGLFDRKLTADGKSIAALPVPIAVAWRGADTAGYPAPGEANSLLDKDKNH